METTPDNITSLAPNEIFVFGSNLAGRHGKGAALLAKQKFGAIEGQGAGLYGQSYAIATKDKNLKTLPLKEIQWQIWVLMGFAYAKDDKKFLVTKIGCGLAGYSPDEIAPLFWHPNLRYPIPSNMILPAEFWVFQP